MMKSKHRNAFLIKIPQMPVAAGIYFMLTLSSMDLATSRLQTRIFAYNMNYTKATFILSLFLGVLFECRAQSTDTIYQSVTIQQFDSLTHVTPNAVIVDVRSPVDYVEAYIPNAVNIDYTGKYWLQVVEHMDKEPTYFLYCLDGEIAPVAAEYMHLQGVKHIYVLDTGLEGWIQAKMPTAKHDVDLRSRQ